MGTIGERGDQGASRAVLAGFRDAFYGCLSGWSDALFELTDAALCGPAPVGSVPSLSLEPVFRRSHGSLYKALARGRIDAEAFRHVLVTHRPAGWPPVFAVDASTWDRCDAETSPERGFYYSASKHSAGQPIVAGWSYQWISQLDWAPDSWTAPLDALRIPPRADTVAATIAQVGALVGHLPADGGLPLFVFDAGYDPIALGAGLADTRAAILVRIRSDRVFYPDPLPTPPGAVGRPRRHGARFACADPAGRLEPDAVLTTHDPRYGNVRVEACGGRDPGSPTSMSAGGRTCGASISSTPSGSRRARLAGPPRPCAPPSRPTAGPGSSSRPTQSSASPGGSLPTTACPGNVRVTPRGSLRRGSAGGFVDFVPPSARRPGHRNPTRPVLDAQRAPAVPHEPAIRRSREPPDEV